MISVDPGVECGYALWCGGFLFHCGCCSVENLVDLLRNFQQETYPTLVIEVPQIYPRSGRGDPNDLIKLAVSVGRLVQVHELTQGNQSVQVFPHAWKGSVPKKIHNARVVELLNAEELKLLRGCKLSATKIHNVLDAIGLGKWYLEKRENSENNAV